MPQTVPSHFAKFIREVNITESQKADCITGHRTLRDRLHSDEKLKPLLVETFLQGSYRRSTIVRPRNDKKSDVDVIVVTRIKREDHKDPNTAMDLFKPFLEKHYSGKYQKQGRSFGIELSYVALDLVITSAPSAAEEKAYFSKAVTTEESIEEAADWRLVKSWVPFSEREGEGAQFLLKEARKETEWKLEPLWIPDRDAKDWKRTHPLAQIVWTKGKNARCDGFYVAVVKAIKWWQRVNHPDDRPKGYPLEHLVGVCCPDAIESIAEGVTKVFENLVVRYGANASLGIKPVLADHGVPEHDVFGRVTSKEFAQFMEHAKEAAKLAKEAYEAASAFESINKWRTLFGDKFPPPGDEGEGSDSPDPKGPFASARSQTGDMSPRRYGSNGSI